MDPPAPNVPSDDDSPNWRLILRSYERSRARTTQLHYSRIPGQKIIWDDKRLLFYISKFGGNLLCNIRWLTQLIILYIKAKGDRGQRTVWNSAKLRLSWWHAQASAVPVMGTGPLLCTILHLLGSLLTEASGSLSWISSFSCKGKSPEIRGSHTGKSSKK